MPYAKFALDVHDTVPKTLDLDALQKQVTTEHSPLVYVPGALLYASFTHLIGYTSNYNTYVLDKVIAADFFSAFDTRNLLDGPAALR